MKKRITKSVAVVGMDLGNKDSQLCMVDRHGERVTERKVQTTEAGLRKVFGDLPPCRIVLEAGTQARWVSKLLVGLGHEVKVVQPRKMRRIYENDSKSDVVDARELAEAGLTRWKRLPASTLRDGAIQAKLDLLRVRDLLVCQRTAGVNLCRSLLKQEGVAVRKCETAAFAKKARLLVPEQLLPSLSPLLDEIEFLTARIKELDRKVEEMGSHEPGIQSMRQVGGVGALTAAAYAWTVGDPRRFQKSRQAGSFFGLRPKRDQSGETDKQLSITKAGDPFMRRLLVQSAHYILGPFGPDSALRRWGLKLAERGGKRAKRKAVVAVARKLAVLLHRLWVTGEVYEAFPETTRRRVA